MNQKLREKIKRHNRISRQIESLGKGLSYCSGQVIDYSMPFSSNRVVCNITDLVDVSCGFLESNPVILKHLQTRDEKIAAYQKERAEIETELEAIRAANDESYRVFKLELASSQ